MENIPVKLPEGADDRSSLQKRRDRQLLKKSLRPATRWEAEKGADMKSGSEKKDYQVAVNFEGKRHEFSLTARDAEDALARARWFLMHEYLGSSMDKVELILALDESQIELSEKMPEA